MARRKEAHGGGHGWFVTFADLMGLLVSFFVMLVAFSTQDQAKLQVVAGSMRDAFGVQDRVRYSGIIEVMGLPTRPRLKNAAHIDPKDASATPSPDEHDHQRTYGARFKHDRNFALAAASLRQALQEMPDIARGLQAHHGRGDQERAQYRNRRPGWPLDVPGRRQGTLRAHAQADREARPRAQGHAVPRLHHRPHRFLEGAGQARLRGLGPFRRPRQCGAAEFSKHRACPSGHIYEVAGKADTDPLFPDNPYMSPNRRVTITLMREAPPLPADFKP